jgi:hypothetical protein
VPKFRTYLELIWQTFSGTTSEIILFFLCYFSPPAPHLHLIKVVWQTNLTTGGDSNNTTTAATAMATATAVAVMSAAQTTINFKR